MYISKYIVLGWVIGWVVSIAGMIGYHQYTKAADSNSDFTVADDDYGNPYHSGLNDLDRTTISDEDKIKYESIDSKLKAEIREDMAVYQNEYKAVSSQDYPAYNAKVAEWTAELKSMPESKERKAFANKAIAAITDNKVTDAEFKVLSSDFKALKDLKMIHIARAAAAPLAK